jgi:tetratricopeptide (TPR) repeat protein
MNRASTNLLVLVLLLAAGFALATVIQPRAVKWSERAADGSVLKVLLGDSRRLFANHFFVEADVSFHSGYYPSIFDQSQAPKDSRHMTAKEGEPEAEAHEKQMNFLREPRDWVERFGRHFLITDHTHLQGGGEREILPWLRLSAELDPQKVETYTVAAYWLRDLGKVQEAESFLREGLRSNPDSYEILFELGRLYNDNYHETARARNVWELALRKWMEQTKGNQQPDVLPLGKIAINLARLEETDGNIARAITLLELARKASPNPETLQRQIDDLKQKLKALPSSSQAPGAS